MPIPPPFIPYLLEHKAQQEEMRAVAGDGWEEYKLVFTRPDGRPLAPRQDWGEFKELLAEAGIDDRRLYDGGRHTAGTILNELGVDMPTSRRSCATPRSARPGGTSRAGPTCRRTPCAAWATRFMPSSKGQREPSVETRNETTDSRAARALRRRRVR